MADQVLPTDLLARINQAVKVGDVITTLTHGKPNTICGIDSDGIWVETERSRDLGRGPQLVPAALLIADWETLTTTGELTMSTASHRGAFASALFSKFDDVTDAGGRPRRITFELVH